MFQINSLPKKIIFGQERSRSREEKEKEEKKCELITSILKRYKVYTEEKDNPENCRTPNISSLKLNTRYKEEYKERESIKFYPMRPGKIIQEHQHKKEKRRRPKDRVLGSSKPKEMP